MTPDLPIIVGLLVFVGFREWYWSRQVHKLIDKLMSRNYYEYKQAESPNVPLRSKPDPEDEPKEDLGTLRDFSPL